MRLQASCSGLPLCCWQGPQQRQLRGRCASLKKVHRQVGRSQDKPVDAALLDHLHVWQSWGSLQTPASGAQAAGSSADGTEAQWIAAARSALAPIWRELDDELHRHEASLPAGFTLARWVVGPFVLCLCMGCWNGRLTFRLNLRSSFQATSSGHWHCEWAPVGARPGAAGCGPHSGAGRCDSCAVWRAG
jgi:hypothetical protein